MRSIKLKSPLKANGLYELHLGNGAFFCFKSKRAADAFISRTNNYLTGVMVQLNVYYMSVFCFYRDVWFFFDKNYHQDLIVQNSLRAVQELFIHNLTVCRGQNGSCLVFVNIKKQANYLIEALFALRKVAKRRGETVSVYRLDGLKSEIELLKQRLDAYGKDRCLKVVKIPDRLPAVCLTA